MEITYSQGKKSNQIVFSPQGDLDLYASVAFFNTVVTHFDRTTNQLVVDFSGIQYLDSSGVGALIRLAHHAKAISGSIQLANLTGTPKKVLEMSNIIRLFTIASNVEAALKVWD